MAKYTSDTAGASRLQSMRRAPERWVVWWLTHLYTDVKK